MRKLYSLQDAPKELFLQLSTDTNILPFLEKIAGLLFQENWMIDDHYRGRIINNGYFSFRKGTVYWGIIQANRRTNIILLGLSNVQQKNLKKFIAKNYSFSQR